MSNCGGWFPVNYQVRELQLTSLRSVNWKINYPLLQYISVSKADEGVQGYQTSSTNPGKLNVYMYDISVLTISQWVHYVMIE